MNNPRVSPEKRIAAMRRADQVRRAAIIEQLERVEDALHAAIDHPSISKPSKELAVLREMVDAWPVML